MTSIYSPYAPPASAGSQDDEFADNSGGLPGGWSEADHDSKLTVVEGSAGVRLLHAIPSVPEATAGIYKSIPAGDFTIWTCVSMSTIDQNLASAGLALWEDAAVTTGDIRTIALDHRISVTNVIYDVWGSYNGEVSASRITRAISVDVWPTHLFLRIRRTGTTYAFDFSTDGIAWQRLHSTGALGITPTQFGLYTATGSAYQDFAAIFPFFRYVASDVGIAGLVNGDRITFPAASSAGSGMLLRGV